LSGRCALGSELPTQQTTSNDTEPVAVDGKTLRGAGSTDQAAPYLLAFCTHQTQETLLQESVGAKTNEIPVAQALIPWPPWRGRVCAADASILKPPLSPRIVHRAAMP